MESALPFPITEIQVLQPPLRPHIPTPIYNPLRHQQGVWTRERMQKYFPLYPGLDNEIQSCSSSSSNSSVSTPTPLQPVTMKSSYQEVVNRIQQLTHSYNNSPYFNNKIKTTPHRNPCLNDSPSSSSNSTNSSTSLSKMSLPSYHNYTFNSPTIKQHQNDLAFHHPQSQPTPTINYNLQSPNPDLSNNTSHLPNDLSYDSSSDDDYFLCNKEERQRNLPFGDLITNNKEHDHSRIIFQNVNSLELSSGHHTLELVCDSIGQFEIDIACLAETNTNWKHQSSKTSFQATKKRHWKHSHSITSETDIEWGDIYKPGGTAIITLPPFSPSITTSGSDPTELGRWSYITISGRDNIKLTVLSTYRVSQKSIKHAGLSTNIRQQWQRLEEKKP